MCGDGAVSDMSISLSWRARASSGASTSRQSTEPASAWSSSLVTLLFVFQTGYVRHHLLTEEHGDDVHAAADATAFQQHEHGDGDHSGTHHHKPHPALDHLVELATKHRTSLLMTDFIPWETFIDLTRPDVQILRIRHEIRKVSGESPPDPRQPRAPQLV